MWHDVGHYSERRKRSMILQVLALIAEAAAVYGAGVVSTMFSFEPELPEELK